ncbi:MAG: hypothetical protein LRY53_09135 [Burkholderiaceae bacterium]|nr:hypothetical protein [Burkholderiaceae bacterium]MCD8516363.1 hypothetical protein [Burkholderiaceae bacterium]MCD8538237.1 hypothetical protein [Burkholderiaceae bacterium]MCD8565776.1 hypothetical protein [Burkholderiaceae bacterium]
MSRKMLTALFLAGLLSRVVFVAHSPVIARVWSKENFYEQTGALTYLGVVSGVNP